MQIGFNTGHFVNNPSLHLWHSRNTWNTDWNKKMMLINWGLTMKFTKQHAVAAWSHCTSRKGTPQSFLMGAVQATLPVPAWWHGEILFSNPIAHVRTDGGLSKGCRNCTARVESKVFPFYPRNSRLGAGAWHRCMVVERPPLPWKRFAVKIIKRRKKKKQHHEKFQLWMMLSLIGTTKGFGGQHSFRVYIRIPKFDWSEGHLTVLH